MRALCWHGKATSGATPSPIPGLEDDRDIIIKVTSCAICGSDLHLMNGYMPTMGQTHTQRYMEPLLAKIESGEIDPTFVITHKTSLEEGPELYKTFRDKKDGCIKVVIQPHAA
jgi:threonine dehydrogenase-like Zn-dependent dehydrogenase